MGLELKRHTNGTKAFPIFIIGGGPSLSSFSWDLIGDPRNVIAVNMAVLDLICADRAPDTKAFFSEDLRVIGLLAKEKSFLEWQGTKIFHALKPDFAKQALELDPSLKIIERTRSDKFWSRKFEDGLSLSSSSGAGAMNVAHILGGNPIYLLGFDCRSKNGMEQNFHHRYEDAGLDRTSDEQYRNFARDFEAWVAPHVMDREVYNLVDPEFVSSIRLWPHIDRDKFLRTGERIRVTGRGQETEALAK